ncbi:hypothetical protein KKD62_03595 [Patescibacteria group bacterium]|nr:hypothetical protein [Patescibacteria group bacterium]MBU1931784.1 hypothetical protein [Patescibacteria group bacterium]
MPDIYTAVTTKPEPKKTAKRETVADRLEKERVDGALKAYLVRPHRVRFETQDKKEKVVLLLRRHWLTNVGWLLTSILMLLSPLILKLVPLLSFLPRRFQIMTLILWYLMTLAFIFEKFLAWYFNVNIITDERIIDIDFYSLGYKEVSEAKIDKVQDVSYITGGGIRSLFNYGDVLIQTAGEKPQLIFEAVPTPQIVAKLLNELILEEEQEKLDGRAR